MDPKSFVTDQAGDVRRVATGYWTFVPRPLPPRFEFTPELALLLSQADAALARPILKVVKTTAPIGA